LSVSQSIAFAAAWKVLGLYFWFQLKRITHQTTGVILKH